MHQTTFRAGLLAAAMAACAFSVSAQTTATLAGSSETSQTQKQPNIILILADDLDYADLSITGGKKVETPNIDSIAKNGAQFTNAYVTCPVCGPSRVGILTGIYQDRFGYVSNHGPVIPENFGLPTTATLVSEMLKDAGYSTGMVGKWHIGFKTEMTPNGQGFDYFFGHLHGAHDYQPGVEKPGPILRNDKPVKTTQYLTTAFGDEAVQFIGRSKDNPYFLYVPFNAVHTPLQAPEETRKKFENIKDDRDRAMAAMIYEMDNSVGDILKAVRDSGQEDNTLIVFFNDNGGTRGNLSESNGVLRDGKATVYEGGIRVPLFIQWNGVIPAGLKYEKPVIALDLTPTFLAAANTTTTSDLEGVDLLPFITGKNTGTPHEALFWKWTDAPNQKAVRMGDWKAVQPADGAPWALYNLNEDIGETKDVAQENSEKVAELRKAWQVWNRKNAPPLFLDSRLLKAREKLAAENDSKTSKPAVRKKGKRNRNKAKQGNQ